MGNGSSGAKNSISGRKTRDFNVDKNNLIGEQNRWNNEFALTEHGQKVIKIIQNAPVGTEITVRGKEFLKGNVEETFRITGTLRNKVINSNGERLALNKDNILDILDVGYDNSVQVHMKKTPKTVSEKKAQQEESNAERRQFKLF